jgi:predicted nucleotidyltransferase
MLSSTEIIQFLKENKTFIKQQFHCSEIGLFGSFARNENTEISDIDILVVFEPHTANLYETELELKNYLHKQFNRKIDICAKKWIKPVFKTTILNEAVYA